jgi:hypothetical protein
MNQTVVKMSGICDKITTKIVTVLEGEHCLFIQQCNDISVKIKDPVYAPFRIADDGVHKPRGHNCYLIS